MSKKSAGEAGTHVKVNFASGRTYEGSVVAATDDGFLEFADGTQVNTAHAETIVHTERPALPDEDSESSES